MDDPIVFLIWGYSDTENGIWNSPHFYGTFEEAVEAGQEAYPTLEFYYVGRKCVNDPSQECDEYIIQKIYNEAANS